MKKKSKLFFVFLTFICALIYTCNSDSEIIEDDVNSQNEIQQFTVEQKKGSNQIEYNPKGLCPLSGPPCVLRGSSTIFTIDCNDVGSNGTVIWVFEAGVGISAVIGTGTSQSFTFSSSFNGGWIQAICNGSFGCKDYIDVVPCNIIDPPICYISGPSCGFTDSSVTFTFIGSPGQSVNWSSSGTGITLSNGQGTNVATFQLGSSFTGGTIFANDGNCFQNFTITDCCVPSLLRVNSQNVIEILKE